MKVDIISVEKITVGERFRKDHGDITSLGGSMKQHGQLQTVAVKEKPDGSYDLLAGGRRIAAAKQEGIQEIAVMIFPEGISDLEARCIELSENFDRKDLEFHENLRLTAEIHRLMQEVHGPKISTSPNAPGWGMKETGQLLGKDKGVISREVNLAKMYEADPEAFSDCKNKYEMEKKVGRMAKQLAVKEMAQKVESRGLGKRKQDLADGFIVNDFFEGARGLPKESFNLVEVDPPYGIRLKEQKKGYIYGDSYNEISSSDYKDFLGRLLRSCYSLMAQHSWIILWYGQEPWQETAFQELLKAGFDCDRMFGAWIKPTGQTMQPSYHLANTIECFYYARKGSPSIAKQGRPNAFHFSPVSPEQKVHPTERPKELMSEVLSTFGYPGNRVLVPCCGSGVTMLAAYELGMQPIGFELSKEYRDSFLVKVSRL
jgi:DNA modification methylase